MARPHEDNDLPYRSPVGIGVAAIATDEDEADISTIGNILRIFEEAKATCSDMNALNLDDPKLTTDQQVFAYQFALNTLILPLEALCVGAIGDVRLKQETEKNK